MKEEPDPTAEAGAAPPERRRQERRALRTDAEVQLPGGQRFAVRTLDISSGGLAIVASANPRPGTAFTVRLRLPSRDGRALPFSAAVRVVHSVLAADRGGFKVGLQFVTLEPAAAQALMRFLG